MSDYSSREERLINRVMNERKINLEGFCDTPMADAILNSATVQPGGRQIEETVASTPVNRTQFFDTVFGPNSGHTFSGNDIPDNFKNFKMGWTKLFTPCAVDEIELEMARDEFEVVDYIESMLGIPSDEHKLKYARNLIHGSASSSPTQFVGILEALQADGNTTYGGLQRRDYPSLLATVVDASDVAGTTQTITNVTAVESSNLLIVDGDRSSKLTKNKIIHLTDATMAAEKRTIVDFDYNTTVSGKTTIWVHQVLNQSGTYDTGTIESRLDDAAYYGASDKFTIEKLDAGYTHTKGRIDCVVTSEWGYDKIMAHTRAHEYALSDAERKRIGFSGYHKAIKYQGADVFIDEHMPAGEFIGTNFKDWNFKWLGRYKKMQFRKSDAIKHLFSAGEYNVGAEGYVLLNVGAFFSLKLNRMFRLKNAG